jgi:hypothetical protein
MVHSNHQAGRDIINVVGNENTVNTGSSGGIDLGDLQRAVAALLPSLSTQDRATVQLAAEELERSNGRDRGRFRSAAELIGGIAQAAGGAGAAVATAIAKILGAARG